MSERRLPVLKDYIVVPNKNDCALLHKWAIVNEKGYLTQLEEICTEYLEFPPDAESLTEEQKAVPLKRGDKKEIEKRQERRNLPPLRGDLWKQVFGINISPNVAYLPMKEVVDGENPIESPYDPILPKSTFAINKELETQLRTLAEERGVYPFEVVADAIRSYDSRRRLAD